MELANFERWLHAASNRLLGPGHPMHDDLVSEGAIAMWRANEKNQEADEGRRISFAIHAAERRMKDVAWFGRPATGHEPMRGSQPAATTAVLDAMLPDDRESIMPQARDIAEMACLAYHAGDIARALDGLSPSQRAAAVAVMNDDQLTKTEKNNWYKARERLAVQLAHLDC